MKTATKRKSKMRIEQGRFPSSPERRAAAKSQVEHLKADKDRLYAEIKAFGDTVTPLVQMAKFVVDVEGDPTAVARLKEALERHQAKEAAKREESRVIKELREARSAATYYRWKAGEIDTQTGIGLFFIAGSGDTKAEAIANAKAKNR
jgi:hypothetical protein